MGIVWVIARCYNGLQVSRRPRRNHILLRVIDLAALPNPDERLGAVACGRRESLVLLGASIWFVLDSETTFETYHVRSCSQKIRFISTIGGSRPVSVSQAVFVVRLIWNRPLLAQTWYA